MSNKNFDMLPQELKDCKSTLKKLSYDDKNKEYMIESDIEAIDFDKVKEIYVNNNLENVNPNPKSNDALHFSEDGIWTFIEFKNGVINNSVNFEINKKIYDSLLILFDINFDNSEIKFKNNISFTRKNMNYILVYNKEKYNEKQKTRQTEDGIRRQKECLQYSKSRDVLKKSIFKLAGEKLILFGLDQFKGYFFNEVNTYTKDEFEENFISKYKK